VAAKKAKKRGLLPATKAVRYLREQGWIAGPAELKLGKVSKDWGGFADIIADGPDGVLYLQVTGWTNFASRRTKILENADARTIVSRPNRIIEVWSYKPGRDLVPDRVERLTKIDFDDHDRRTTRNSL